MSFLTRRSVLAAAIILSLAGCKSKEPVVEQTLPPPPPPPAPLSVTSVELGKRITPDHRIADQTTTFGLRDTIYASVHTEGASSNATLSVKWMLDNGQLVDSMSVPIAPTGADYTEFHIMRPKAWPVGKYKVEVGLNGAKVSDKDFEVKK